MASFGENVGNWYKRNARRIVFIMIVYVIAATLFNYLRIRLMHFNGIVDAVTYTGADDHVAVVIKGERYNLLCTWWSYSTRIEPGDKMIKIKGDMHLKIIKPGKKDTIDFYSDK